MESHTRVAMVTILALLVYFGMGLQVARARGKSGIDAPAMTGDPLLERSIRAHYNTLEWLPIFLVSLWLFALYWSDLVATLTGIVWIIGRLLYARGYIQEAGKRSLGFLVQSAACAVLLFGAMGRILWMIATGVG